MPNFAGGWSMPYRRYRSSAKWKFSATTNYNRRKKPHLTELLNNLELIYLSPASYEIAIQLRQQRKLTLGDALIAASCLERGYALATCNTGDFAWIDELKVFNPLEAG
jgi:hypothetical protein